MIITLDKLICRYLVKNFIQGFTFNFTLQVPKGLSIASEIGKWIGGGERNLRRLMTFFSGAEMTAVIKKARKKM